MKSNEVALRSLFGPSVLMMVLSALLLSAPARAFDLQGHRGTRGLAPENTLTAFRKAMALGVSTLELDVGLTRDGHVVVSHERRINADLARDKSGQWLAQPGPPLHTLTLAEVQSWDVGRLRPGTVYARTYPEQVAADGETIPTLDALFTLVSNSGNTRLRFNIETKVNPLEPNESAPFDVLTRELLAVIKRHGMQGRVTVQSFDWRTLRLVQQLEPHIPTSALSARQSFMDNLSDARWTAGLRLQDHGDSVPRLAKAVGAKIWSPYHGELTQPLVQEAQALGLKVVPYTVNAPEQIDRLVTWGVDGIISDYPDRVQKVLAQRGVALDR